MLDQFSIILLDEGQERLEGSLHQVGNLPIFTDFIPTPEQVQFILRMNTILSRSLFTEKQRREAGLDLLLARQILDYVETYGLGHPGLFNIPVNEQEMVQAQFIRGLTREEAVSEFRAMITLREAIERPQAVASVVKCLNVPYSIDEIKSNELRILLFRPGVDKLKDGDDLVRILVYHLTGKSIVVKNKEIFNLLRTGFSSDAFLLLDKSKQQAAEVFHRHKPIFMAIKSNKVMRDVGIAPVINKISKMAKQLHKPISEPASRTIIRDALTGHVDPDLALPTFSTRDLFRVLNAIGGRLAHVTGQVYRRCYFVRNGKVFHEQREPKAYETTDGLKELSFKVLAVLEKRLRHLQGKSILLDPRISFGLPISEKRALGNLPAGTRIALDTDMPFGIYWDKDSGAEDLDLSLVDKGGERYGWGGMSAYSSSNVYFSGDMTYPRPTATEFYLFRKEVIDLIVGVNVYAGRVPCKMRFVVGKKSDVLNRDNWNVDELIVSADFKLRKYMCFLGRTVRSETGSFFLVNPLALDNSHTSFRVALDAVFDMMAPYHWTVDRLLMALGIPYDTVPMKESYDLVFSPDTPYHTLESEMLGHSVLQD
ncbi:MAG: hypothetical protein D6698_02470 [Gammaproteobacteria bacterium]|nr:MAG: hypothetical protein D6698_02470 [Gammaproteobacteria bacterium]